MGGVFPPEPEQGTSADDNYADAVQIGEDWLTTFAEQRAKYEQPARIEMAQHMGQSRERKKSGFYDWRNDEINLGERNRSLNFHEVSKALQSEALKDHLLSLAVQESVASTRIMPLQWSAWSFISLLLGQVEDAPPLVCQDQEDVENFKSDRGYG
jgi:hypothetical protein